MQTNFFDNFTAAGAATIFQAGAGITLDGGAGNTQFGTVINNKTYDTRYGITTRNPVSSVSYIQNDTNCSDGSTVLDASIGLDIGWLWYQNTAPTPPGTFTTGGENSVFGHQSNYCLIGFAVGAQNGGGSQAQNSGGGHFYGKSENFSGSGGSCSIHGECSIGVDVLDSTNNLISWQGKELNTGWHIDASSGGNVMLQPAFSNTTSLPSASNLTEVYSGFCGGTTCPHGKASFPNATNMVDSGGGSLGALLTTEVFGQTIAQSSNSTYLSDSLPTLTLGVQNTINGNLTLAGDGSANSGALTINGQNSGSAVLTSNATGGILNVSVPINATTGYQIGGSVTANHVLVGNLGYYEDAASVGVASGGTGITSGTAGGVLGFTGSTTLASSSALSANALVVGSATGTGVPTTGNADFTYVSHTLAAGSSGILDLHNAPLSTGLWVPEGTTSLPTADGQLAFNTTTGVHHLVVGHNGSATWDLTPMTGSGDMVYGGTNGAPTRLPAGTANQLLVGGTTPAFTSAPVLAAGGSITSLDTGTPGLTWGTNALTINGNTTLDQNGNFTKIANQAVKSGFPGVPVLVASDNVTGTNTNASVGPNNIFTTPSNGSSGVYRVCGVSITGVADATGTIQFQVNYTATSSLVSHTRTASAGPVSATSTGAANGACEMAYPDPNTTITYKFSVSSTTGGGSYDVHVWVERLQ